MYSKYRVLFNDADVDEILNTCALFTQFKCLIINIIEELPEEIFLLLKVDLIAVKLISTPDEGTIRRKYRRFLNKYSRELYHTQSNKELELLVQKNLLLIDLGFIYFIDILLKRLLEN